MMRAFPGTDTAALADCQIGLKPGWFAHNALGRTKEPTTGTHNTAVAIHHRSFSAPVTCIQSRILRSNGAKIIGYL